LYQPTIQLKIALWRRCVQPRGFAMFVLAFPVAGASTLDEDTQVDRSRSRFAADTAG
jgi:hypothetical protein